MHVQVGERDAEIGCSGEGGGEIVVDAARVAVAMMVLAIVGAAWAAARVGAAWAAAAARAVARVEVETYSAPQSEQFVPEP
jgi:hypothetical protein